MSRSKKGAKFPGYEVDRRREGKRGWRDHGRLAKDLAHGAERRQGQKIVRSDVMACLCPLCSIQMEPEHAHYRCPKCGWRDSCCF